MSDIYGDGYGSKHNWTRIATTGNKCTTYLCSCGESFTHWYDQISDIFDAMKSRGVSEECCIYRSLKC